MSIVWIIILILIILAIVGFVILSVFLGKKHKQKDNPAKSDNSTGSGSKKKKDGNK